MARRAPSKGKSKGKGANPFAKGEAPPAKGKKANPFAKKGKK